MGDGLRESTGWRDKVTAEIWRTRTYLITGLFFYSGPTTEDGRECLETCTLPAPREQEALQRGDGKDAQSRDQDRRAVQRKGV